MIPLVMLFSLYGLVLAILSGGIVAGTVKPTWRDFWQVLACLIVSSVLLLTALWAFVHFTASFLSQTEGTW